MLPRHYIKICGITRVEDAHTVVAAGATAVGLNLWPRSPRYVPMADAVTIAEAIDGAVEIVAVCVDPTKDEIRRIATLLSPNRIQVHGKCLHQNDLGMFFAIGLNNEASVAEALGAPGVCVLVDAHSQQLRGGTGVLVPEELARSVCCARTTIMAGGLTPQNVAERMRACSPAGVDVASGVESCPGVKDPIKVQRFVAAAKTTFEALDV